MNGFKKFFTDKRAGFYCSAVALLCAVAGLILYLITMTQQNRMYEHIIIITVLGIAVACVTLYKDYFRALSILSAALYLAAGTLFVVTQLDNIGYAITDTNIGDGIMPSFVAGAVFYLLATVVGIFAACLRQEKQIK